MFGIKKLTRALRNFRRNEDGGPTIEFVLVFMPFMVLSISSFEMGLLMTRHVMLERGVDMAVRDVRLNSGSPIDEVEFKRLVCNAAGIIPDCMNTTRLNMVSVDLRETSGMSTSSIPREADCIDANDPFKLPRDFENGTANEMMVVRACGLFSPILPEFGLGYFLTRISNDGGLYRLISTTAFVMEPA